MEITETTAAVDPKWPRWAWFVFPALAITIGGSLGYVVAIRETPEASAEPIPLTAPSQVTIRPIVDTPAPVPPAPPPATGDPATAAAPEVEPEPSHDPPAAAATGTLRHPPVRPKQKPKPTKTNPCNVYDHMNGC